MSTLALFLALAGGTAVAATALPRNSVGTVHLKKNAVTSVKVKDRSIRGADVDATQVQLRVGQGCPEGQSIRAIDVKGGVTCEVDDRGGSGGGQPSGAAGGDLAGSYPNPTLRNGAVTGVKVADGTLTGAKIANNTLAGSKIVSNSLTGDHINEATLGRVPSALLGGFGRSGAITNCDPPRFQSVFCAGTPILDVPQGARALVFGRLRAGSGEGSCRLSASSIGQIENTQLAFTASYPNSEQATLVGVTPPLPAGPTSFGLECSESASSPGNWTLSWVSASVVLISGA